MTMAGELHELWRNGRMLAWLERRPAYCDRGRFHANVDIPVFISEADTWPRYYFDLERGKLELLAYLTAKGIEVDGAEWRFVPSPLRAEMGAFLAELEAPKEQA